MFDSNLLLQFLSVAEHDTLSEAAKELHISQPALSKAMKKLEEYLSVPLFNRSRNKITLNDNGVFFAQKVRKLLKQEEEIISTLKAFDASHRSLHIGICAPVMQHLLPPFLKDIFPDKQINVELVPDDQLVARLKANEFHLIVTHDIVPSLYCHACADEQLYVLLPKNHPLANNDEVYFADLDGTTFLRMREVGFWDHIVDTFMPNSRYILQDSREDFYDIANASTIPTFTSDYSIVRNITIPNRITLPIADDEAYVTYYLCCLKSERIYYQDLFDQLNINTFR